MKAPQRLTAGPGVHTKLVGERMKETVKRDGRTTLREIFALFRSSKLSSEEKALWVIYRSYDSGAGAHPGDEVLGEHMGKSVRSVQTYRTRLIDRGFLTKEFRGRNPSLFRTAIPVEAPQDSAVQTDVSTAAHCGTNPVAPQVVPQPTAPPPHTPPYRMSTGSVKKMLTPKEKISEKRLRYTAEQLRVIDQAVDAFRSTRKTNSIADSVILAEFQWWERHNPESVTEGLRTYLEKGYATEGKAEKYVRGIVRNIRPGGPGHLGQSGVTYDSLRSQS